MENQWFLSWVTVYICQFPLRTAPKNAPSQLSCHQISKYVASVTSLFVLVPIFAPSSFLPTPIQISSDGPVVHLLPLILLCLLSSSSLYSLCVDSCSSFFFWSLMYSSKLSIMSSHGCSFSSSSLFQSFTLIPSSPSASFISAIFDTRLRHSSDFSCSWVWIRLIFLVLLAVNVDDTGWWSFQKCVFDYQLL